MHYAHMLPKDHGVLVNKYEKEYKEKNELVRNNPERLVNSR